MPLSSLTNIPRIMRKNGFHEGAQLMDRWFNHAAAVKPRYAAADTRTIKMRWVLGYARAKEVYDELINDRMWATPNARKLLRERLQQHGYLQPGALAVFGPPPGSMDVLDTYFVNQLPVTTDNKAGRALSNSVDGMLAALGTFSLRMVIAGELHSPSKNPMTGQLSYPLAVSDVGIYVRDSFDFEDEQDLGYWDDEENTIRLMKGSVREEVAYRMVGGRPDTHVSNAIMRGYREATGFGGDFVVYSNVHWTHLSKPDIIAV